MTVVTTSASCNNNDIRNALKSVGLQNIDKDTLSKCTALAKNLHLTPVQIAECWEVYSLNKNVSQLTEHTFQSYRLELIKTSEKLQPSPSPDDLQSSGVVVPRKGGLGKRRQNNETTSSSNIPLVTPPPSKRVNSGGNSDNGSNVSAVDKVAIDTLSSSPAAKVTTTKSASFPKYDERKGSGQVVLSFNPQAAADSDNGSGTTTSTSSSSKKCTLTYSFDTNVKQPYRHMFTTLEERAQALDNHLTNLGDTIASRYGIGTEKQQDDDQNAIAPLEAVGVPRQDRVCCIGRICNSAHEGRINQTSVVLEGSRNVSGGARVEVDLSHMRQQKSSSFSLFPGQIVAVEGMNPTGRKMVAHRICEGAAHAPEKSTIKELMRYHHHEDHQNGAPLKMMSVCGPYTTSDNLDYNPLYDFFHEVQTEQPDLVIMVGPFVDLRHGMVQNGETALPFDDGKPTIVSLEAFFANKVAVLLEEFFADSEAQTQFVLVPSLDDATAEWVYPQAPFMDRIPGHGKQLDIPGAECIDSGTLGLHHVETVGRPPSSSSGNKTRRRVHCLPNPSTLRVNELVIGVSGTDCLFHINCDETNANLEVGSRLARISQHMLQQQSYYPLFPPNAANASLDWKQSHQWNMPCRPDILIMPSKLTHFCKSVLKSTLVVNPGYLSRDTTGGTYAVMNVHPIKRETLEDNNAGGDEVTLEHGVPDRTHVEIKRI